jgi:hypothetical protein
MRGRVFPGRLGLIYNHLAEHHPMFLHFPTNQKSYLVFPVESAGEERDGLNSTVLLVKKIGGKKGI